MTPRLPQGPFTDDLAEPAGVAAAPPSLHRTPPGSAYTDPARFERERDLVLGAGWNCVARVEEVSGVGAFVTAQVGRESVVVVRGADDELRAFLNVCRHRGAQVCTEDSGRLRRNLRCPYHAWTYDLGGDLVAAPNLSDLAGPDRASLGLHAVGIEQWLGYVWVCVAEDPPPFDEVVDAVAERLGDRSVIDDWHLGDLRVGRTVSYDVAANWKLIVENFMECYHCAAIHPELVDVLPEFADGFAAQYFVGHGAAFADDVDGFTIDGAAGQPRLHGLPETRDRRYFAATIRPQVFLNLVPDHAIVLRMTPVAADRTLVVCDWLFEPETVAAAEAGSIDLEPSIQLFDAVNRQDFAACERTQPGMASRAYDEGGLLVPSEHHLADFHRWVEERLGSG